MRSTERASTFARAILLSAIAAVPAAAQERMTRISQRHRQEGDGNSPARPDLCAMASSADDRWVVFDSHSSNLVLFDPGGVADVFVIDRTTGVVAKLSGGNGPAFDPDISANGRYACFVTSASDFYAPDTNGVDDVYWVDRDPDANGIYDEGNQFALRVSVDSSGNEANGASSSPTISADGTCVCFMSGASNLVAGDTNSSWDAFIHDVYTGVTERVSLTHTGGESKSGCALAGMSGNGNVIAFESYSDDFVPKDGNAKYDVFVRDLKAQTTERVSVGDKGTEGNDDSLMVKNCLSYDGFTVAWESWATNLYSNDTNAHRDVFVRDRLGASTALASVDDQGVPGNHDSFGATIDDGGSKVAFSTLSSNLDVNDGNGTYDVCVHDLGAGTTRLVSVNLVGTSGLYRSDGATISGSGALIAFGSQATDLVGDKTTTFLDVFARDTGLGKTTRLSVGAPSEANGASKGYASATPDGRFVAFESDAWDLVGGDTNDSTDVFVLDRSNNRLVRVSVATDGSEGNGPSYDPAISADGRFVAFASGASNFFPGDGFWSHGYFYNYTDVFVHDRDANGNGTFDEPNGTTTTLVSQSTQGVHYLYHSYDPAISGDGSRIAFTSQRGAYSYYSWSGRDVFLRDQAVGTTTLVSKDPTGTESGDGHSHRPSISADGSTVVFESRARNLAASDAVGDLDIFARDLASEITTLISVDSFGGSHVGDCFLTKKNAVSSDGTQIVFASVDAALDPNDTNGLRDVFVHDRITGATVNLTILTSPAANADSWEPAISPDGQYVAFTSLADSFDPLDSNGVADVFLHDRYAVTTSIVSTDCAGLSGDAASGSPVMTGLVQPKVLFASDAADLVRGDGNQASDLFLFDPAIPPDDAYWINYGAGFPGTLGVPSLTLSADPVLGSSITMDLGNSRGVTTIALLYVSPAPASIPTGYGATFLVDLAASIPLAFTLAPGGLSLPGDVPLDDTLCDVSIYFQALELDFGAVRRISFTPGLEAHFGH